MFFQQNNGVHGSKEAKGSCDPLRYGAPFKKLLFSSMCIHWISCACPGSMTSSPGASFLEQLTEKAARHAALLDCLAESAVLYRLEADVQRVLLENAEKLAVALALLNLQASLQAAAAQGQQGAEFELMLQVLHHAGQISGSRGGGAGAGTELLQPLELFYAQPSISMPALLQVSAQVGPLRVLVQDEPWWAACRAAIDCCTDGLQWRTRRVTTLLRLDTAVGSGYTGTCNASCKSAVRLPSPATCRRWQRQRSRSRAMQRLG